ncbi:DUF7260 family protein [Halobaculum limi]|uniref:DUF7260 family protein n=1 Tax=Halobaculum limi TaxID=3031916 RepID=UPI0024055B28|nr:hypothetical protein [Halobaculum sp. YSMS11]
MGYSAGGAKGVGSIDQAIQCVEREDDVLATEVSAFKRFRTLVSRVDPEGPSPRQVGNAGPAFARATAPDQARDCGQSACSDVRKAYRQTVMATDHYEAEYGETYAESIEAEFGATFAAVLAGGGRFSADVKSQLITAITRGIEDRRATRSTLQRERTALERAGTTLSALRDDLAAIGSRPFVECQYTELRAVREDLQAIERQCERLVTERQTGDFHTAAILLSRESGGSLSQFLYDSLEVTYPILHDAASVGNRVADLRRRIDEQLARRPASAGGPGSHKTEVAEHLY